MMVVAVAGICICSSCCCIVCVCVCVCAVGGMLLARWLERRKHDGALIRGIQALLDKLKEYQLDARAGVIVCGGPQLRVVYIDPILSPLIGQPEFVDDLLPSWFHEKHARLVRRFASGAGKANPLPDLLNHPLRNVPVVANNKQFAFRARLIIGRLEASPLFYVVMQPCAAVGAASSLPCGSSAWRSWPDVIRCCERSASVEDGNNNNNAAATATTSSCKHSDACSLRRRRHSTSFYYGKGAAPYIDCGMVPSDERYERATVLYADIVDFTRQCSLLRPIANIGGWMARIHAAVDSLLIKYAIRKVETRGDCVICVSGTNFSASSAKRHRDMSSDQATRMLAFGQALAAALSKIEGTSVRMGMATGPVMLTHVSHGGDALPAEYIYGDTVNVACRMEQMGRANMVQLAESSVLALKDERAVVVMTPPSLKPSLATPALPPLSASSSSTDPPPQTRRTAQMRELQVKGKGRMRVALYDCASAGFVAEETQKAV